MGNMPARGHRIQTDWRDLLGEGLWEGWHAFGSGLCTVVCCHCGRFWDKTLLFGESGSITFHVLGFCSGTWASYLAVAEQARVWGGKEEERGLMSS